MQGKLATECVEVVVIGSGFAGTSAARYLHDNDVGYVVLEAESFTGGRTQTIHLEGENGINVDTGACFIHGTEGNPLIEQCIVNNVKLKAKEQQQTAIFFQNGNLSFQHQRTVRKEFSKRYKDAKRYLREEYRKGNFSLSMEDGFQESLRRKPLPWNLNCPKQKYFDHYKWILEEYEGANWDEMSILQLNSGAEFAGGNAMLQNGYKELIEAIQQNLYIKTSHEVKHIEYNGNCVITTVINHETSEIIKYESKFVICSVSLGVLKDSLTADPSALPEHLEKGLMRWKPPLPQWKVESLECHKIGLMNKIILQFTEKFWDPISRITYVGNDAGDFPWFDDLGDDPPSLLGWTACRFAEKVEKISDDLIVAHCMKILRTQFPTAPDPIVSHVTRWRSNPLTRGSYSFICKGATQEKVDMIGIPVDNIFFAGEAFAGDHIGCVHGAYITGIKAASTITSALHNVTP